MQAVFKIIRCRFLRVKFQQKLVCFSNSVTLDFSNIYTTFHHFSIDLHRFHLIFYPKFSELQRCNFKIIHLFNYQSLGHFLNIKLSLVMLFR